MARITWLASVLKAAGCEVVEVDGWETRERPDSFNPIGVLWHHTAATSSAGNPYPSLDVVTRGRPDLNGPLCHALIDYDGVFRVVAAGRANHAGDARASGPIPAGSGNAMLIGWEIDYQGVTQDMTSDQYDAAVKGTAAVLRKLGKSAEYARGHRETSVTGKIDPGGINLDSMRSDVAEALRGGRNSISGTSALIYSGALRAFGIGTDGSLWQYIWNGEKWSWQDLGGQISSGPSTVAHGSVLRAFARGKDNSLWQNYWNGDKWTWQDLGGKISSAPGAVLHGGVLRVFARSSDGALWQNYWNGERWTWQDLNYGITSGPSAVVFNNVLRVFARGTDGALWQHTWANGSWSRQSHGGKISGAPSAVVHGGVLRVFARGADGSLWQNYGTGGPGAWQDLEGQITNAPGAVLHGSVLRVFARGTDGALWQNYWNGDKWNWQQIGGQII